MNKLQTLLIFTLLNFVAYGISIDVSELVTYNGEVKFYDLETNRVIECAPIRKTDLSNISILLNEADILPKKINERDYFHFTSKILDEKSRPEVLNHRTRFIDTETFVNKFLAHVYFSTKDINTLSAIRVIMYHIVDNPIGCTLISRILDKLENKIILFKIEGTEFMYLPNSDRNPMETIIIPNIIFSGYKAQRQDITSYGPQQNGESWKFSKHERPFYIGLVHELIHLMHSLENRKTGEEERENLLYSDDFGGEDLWGAGDDLYTIWGVYSITRGFENIVNYDLVSELTFRIYDKIPIRMFCEISKQTSIGDKIILEDYSKGDKSFEEDAGIDPLVTIKSILESIGLEKLITISV